jgi:membrane protein implicated in regulation of membrane protease activity
VTGVVGVVAGLLVGWFAAWLTRVVKHGGSDATPTTGDAIGRDATVLTSIPADGFGTVKVVLGGHSLRYNARAEEPIEAGTPVHVTGVLSPTAVTVAPVWRVLA